MNRQQSGRELLKKYQTQYFNYNYTRLEHNFSLGNTCAKMLCIKKDKKILQGFTYMRYLFVL